MNYCINAAWHEGDHPVALLRCNEAQVALIAAFRSSVLSPWSLNQLLVPWKCGQVPSPAGKLNQRLHEACQQKEA